MNDSVVVNVVKDGIYLRNGIEVNIPCDGEIWSFIELFDRILVLANLFDVVGCNQFRNIFCYSKNTGEQLWQVEQPWQWRRLDPEGREMRKVYVEEVYKLMWLSMYEGNRKLSAEEMRQKGWNYEAIGEGEVKISAFYYFRPFRPKINRIEARTLSHFPKDYTIDIDTGKVDLLEVHQPSEKIY